MSGSRSYRYLVVDVFTEVPFAGNPLAVFPDALGLSDGEMQAIARELNLSESSFVFAPVDARSAARLRIFTPQREVDFAGHPTIGTAFALVSLDRVLPSRSEFVLEENIGPVPIRLERRADPFFAWLRTPRIAFGASYDRAAAAAMLGLHADDLLGELPVQEAGAGLPFIYVALRDPAAVDRAQLDVAALGRLGPESAAAGVFLFAPSAEGAYARMFAPRSGVAEDPATGSATGPLGAYLVKYGLLECRDGLRFVNEQGVRMKRRSLIHGRLNVAGGELESIDVGGSAVRVVEASIDLSGLTLAP